MSVFTSVIPNCCIYHQQSPFKFRVSSILQFQEQQPKIQLTSSRSIHFKSQLNQKYLVRNALLYSGGHFREIRFSPVLCSKKTQQEEDLFASEETKMTTSLSSDRVDTANNESYISLPGGVEYENIEETKHGRAASIRTVAFWVCTAIVFGVGLGFKEGAGKASEFFAGYLLEQSLSVDNLFVFVLIFKYFKVPTEYQSRVLSYGIAGAVIFRLSLILLGTATLQKFEAVNLLLAGILLFSAYKLFAGGEDDSDLSDNFIVKTCQKVIPVTSSYDGNKFFTFQNDAWKATPLLLVVAVIELSDIAFAVDSIPAVFGVTRDPVIVFSSNLFAILGLRSLYTLVSESMSELEYLQPAIATVLGFIGCKMISDFFGFHVSTEVSLGFVATCLSAGVALSLMKRSD
ncbi:thylakoid membrane protein TERC, chloroplastic-like isoform X1 [Papaver somniferum]|nr:thylakoid membrane protein TERC, chloroplastic-like isoform X1 [Papaver somniferum]XP_026426995.1 thylakoid membrane protein TERC, chloroplastic-like isoform X1 [Papaver somniferum]